MSLSQSKDSTKITQTNVDARRLTRLMQEGSSLFRRSLCSLLTENASSNLAFRNFSLCVFFLRSKSPRRGTPRLCRAASVPLFGIVRISDVRFALYSVSRFALSLQKTQVNIMLIVTTLFAFSFCAAKAPAEARHVFVAPLECLSA